MKIEKFGVSIVLTGALILFGSLNQPTMTACAAGPGEVSEQAGAQAGAEQSGRWEGSGDEWRVKDGKGGYLSTTWFQDDATGHWYMLGDGDGTLMYAGLVTDKSTRKTYLMNPEHDGTFGRLVTADGPYIINGQAVYLTFNQEHDGYFGAITSGLTEVRGTGVKETTFSEIPTSRQAANGAMQKTITIVEFLDGWRDKPHEQMTRNELSMFIDEWTNGSSDHFLDGWRNKPEKQMTSKEKIKIKDEREGTSKYGKYTIDTKGGTIDDSWLRG